jgi:Methyltransferase domain
VSARQNTRMPVIVRKARRIPSKIGAAPDYIRRVARSLADEPVETLLYVPEVVARQIDRPFPYTVEEDWGSAFHKLLDLPWPCPEAEGAADVLAEIEIGLEAKGLTFGRYTYGVYSDADPGLGTATWCAVRHLRPDVVVETGVARGVTSRLILEAMSLNDKGHLWSIDLPHPFSPELHHETAAAVPGSSHPRWTYVRGSSRRRLPSLVAHLGRVDVFVHDSLHTARNMAFEMKAVWAALAEGGTMLVDDVHNRAFAEFVEHTGNPAAIVCRSADSQWMFGAIRKGRAHR